MPSIDFKNQVLPHLIAIFIFAFASMLFYMPMIFENKTLNQHDILQGMGSTRELVNFRATTGEEGLWTNSMFGGMPADFISIVYSGDLMIYVFKTLTLWLPYPVGITFISLICFYIMMLTFRVRPWLAISASLAFGFTTFLIISLAAGHNSKVRAIALMPLVFAGIHLAFNKNRILGFVLTALALSVQLKVNHLQITYYLVLITIFYGVNQLINAIKEKMLPDFLKTVGILIIATGLAVGTNIGRLWGIMEYSEYSIRGKSELKMINKNLDKSKNEKKPLSGLNKKYAFEYSNGILEPLVLFIPNFMGGTLRQDLGKNSELEKTLRNNGVNRMQAKEQAKAAPAYWGNQPLSAPFYVGAIVVFLFVLSMFFLEGKQKYWMLTIIIFSIALSWGKNFSTFNYFIFDYLPGYNKFRTVTFVTSIVAFTMILSGFLGLEKLISEKWHAVNRKKFLYALGITAGFASLTALLAGMGSFSGAIDTQLIEYPAFFLSALKEDRENLMRMDALRSLFFVMAFAGVIWFYMKNKLSSTMAFILFGILIFLDLFMVDNRHLNDSNFKRNSKKSYFDANEADQLILQDKDLSYRVFYLFNPFNDARTSYHHKSIGGYHGAKMRRYQDLIENGITNELSEIIASLKSGSRNFAKAGIINMFNTKYLIAGDKANAVIQNPYANGNAWFVSKVKIASSPDEELIETNKIDTKSVAVMDNSNFKSKNTKYSAANIISLLEYKPNYLKYEATCSSDGLAVFSEIYYPKGWSAKIDGKVVDILRVNYILRALDIPSGNHIVEFEYRPESYYIGNKLMWGFNVLVLILFAGGIGFVIRNNK